MAFSGKKNVTSSSPERGSPRPTDLSAQVLQVVDRFDSNEAIPHSFVNQHMKADSCNDFIEPPNALARLMADHSDAEEDPMVMAQIGLVEDDWEFADVEDEDAGFYYRSSTSALIEPHDEFDDFQEVTEEEIKSSNDAAIVHDQHVRALAYHLVPPYPIPPQYAILPKLEDTTYATQLGQYEAFMRACYPGDDEQRKQAIKKANEGFPRYGSPETFVRVVHVNGQVQEISKWQNTKCDQTCPMKKKSFLKKLAGVPGKLLGKLS